MVIDQVLLGLFPTVPGLWLFVLALPSFVLAGRELQKRRPQISDDLQKIFLFAMITSAAAGQFLFLVVFFYGAERYIVDFYLPLIVSLAIIIWQIDVSILRMGSMRLVLWLVVAGLTLWTTAIGYFACFGVPTLVSNYYDPALYARLASYWNERHVEYEALLAGIVRFAFNLTHLH
jgi:hypothetical protein